MLLNELPEIAMPPQLNYWNILIARVKNQKLKVGTIFDISQLTN